MQKLKFSKEDLNCPFGKLTKRKNKMVKLGVKLSEIAQFEPPLHVSNGAMCVNGRINQPRNGIGREEGTPFKLSHTDFDVQKIQIESK